MSAFELIKDDGEPEVVSGQEMGCARIWACFNPELKKLVNLLDSLQVNQSVELTVQGKKTKWRRLL